MQNQDTVPSTAMPTSIDGRTRLYGIAGDPIFQVKSPGGLTSKFVELGANAILVPMHVRPVDFDNFMAAMRGLLNLEGLVMTIPHKMSVVKHLDQMTDRVRFLGAANVIRRITPGGGWTGDVTDGLGMVNALRSSGFDLHGKRALLVGAGGAGSAIALSLIEEGVAELAIHDTLSTRRDGLIARLKEVYAVLWARGADGLYTFNFYNTAEYPLLGELADPAQLARLPKEFFIDACSVPNNATVSPPPLPLGMQANSSARTVLFITDDPAQSSDRRLELAWKGSADLAAPDIFINGVKLEDLRVSRDKTAFTVVSASRLEKGESHLTIVCNSASLIKLLRRGANDFVFTSTSSATLTALSLKITPEFQKPASPLK